MNIANFKENETHNTQELKEKKNNHRNKDDILSTNFKELQETRIEETKKLLETKEMPYTLTLNKVVQIPSVNKEIKCFFIDSDTK